MQNIIVGVSIPDNYQIGSKTEGRRMAVHSWDLTKSERLTTATYGSRQHSTTWFEDCEVLDAEGELPEALHILVRCGREWNGSIGGSSWFASEAFVSRERAEEYVAKWESELSWYWIVTTRRCIE
ncbi:MAG: hypothetical protein Q7R67_00160 [bacterium]|nr:hypothetical protein [bacterium]